MSDKKYKRTRGEKNKINKLLWIPEQDGNRRMNSQGRIYTVDSKGSWRRER